MDSLAGSEAFAMEPEAPKRGIDSADPRAPGGLADKIDAFGCRPPDIGDAKRRASQKTPHSAPQKIRPVGWLHTG